MNVAFFATLNNPILAVAGNGRRVWEVAPIQDYISKTLLIIKLKNYEFRYRQMQAIYYTRGYASF